MVPEIIKKMESVSQEIVKEEMFLEMSLISLAWKVEMTKKPLRAGIWG